MSLSHYKQKHTHAHTHVRSASGALAAMKDMGGRQLEGTRSGVGWFGSEPKEPLVLERGMAAPVFPLPPLPPCPAPSPLPQLTRAPSPPPPPHPLPPAVVLCAAHAGLSPGCLSWLCREQPEPKRGRGGEPAGGSGHGNIWNACVRICVKGVCVSAVSPFYHSVHETFYPLAKHHKKKIPLC